MNRIPFYYYTRRQLWGMTFFLVSAVGTLLALIFFDQYAPSILYDSTTSSDSWWYVQSYAVVLFYYFGGAAFCIPILFLSIFYIMYMQRSLFQEWGRCVACVTLVPFFSWYCAFFTVDYAHGYMPGGFVGRMLLDMSTKSMGSFSSIVMLCGYIISVSALIGKERVVLPVLWIQKFVSFCVAFCNRYSLGIKFIKIIHVVWTYGLYKPLYYVRELLSFIWNILFLQKSTIAVHKDNASEERPLYQSLHNDLYEFQDSYANENSQMYNAPETIDNMHTNELESNEPENDVRFTQEINSTIYTPPQLEKTTLLSQEKARKKLHDEQELRALALEDKLQKFGINGKVVNMSVGPVVTLFEYQPDSDIKLSKILTLEDDLAMAMQALSIRILAPIPGTSVVGFEVSNSTRCDVLLSDVMHSNDYKKFSGTLPIVFGQNITGEPVVVDLAKMPHLLVAGSTGSGKSVALNAMLISLLCKLNPDELKLILIDPKRLEFASYADIAHLEFPIVTDPKKAAPILRWVVKHMEDRYEQMAQAGVRNLVDYNAWAKTYGHTQFPLLVVVIDELADLMLSVGRDIEDLIARIAQMARAAGIHMIVATQRPSVDVITGLIKANFPSRISFRVSSRIDSRTILDTAGAEKLLGKGDMLFMSATATHMERVHGAYVSDGQIDQVAEHIRAIRPPSYRDITVEIATQKYDQYNQEDELYDEVCAFLKTVDEVSISLLQRKFRIGYNRSARIIDMLESNGKIMPPDGSKTRKVIT